MQMYPSKFIEKFKICDNLDTCLRQLHDNAKFAVAISREHALNSHLISASQLYCFEKSEIIYNYHLKFLLHTKFPYKTEMNRFIRMASANGLIAKWHSSTRIKVPQQFAEKVYGVTMIDELILWFYMLISMFLVLLLEIFIHNRMQNSELKLWKSIDMFIDPHRHFWLKNKGSWL